MLEQVLRDTQAKHTFKLIAYQIMDNHIRLVIPTIEEKAQPSPAPPRRRIIRIK